MTNTAMPVTYSLTMSLDGFVSGPDGSLDWGAPDEEVFRLATDEARGLGAHLMGRRLYETMRIWDTVEEMPGSAYSTAEFARVWRAVPKVVFSTSLARVEGNARLAEGTLDEEVARLRGAAGGGDIGIGGAELAAQAARAGLIDEYRVRVCPVLIGGGVPFFGGIDGRRRLELVESRALASQVLYLRYRVLDR